MIAFFLRGCLLVLVLICYLAVSTAFSKAYALVEVKSGESLSVIASRYSIYTSEIMVFNNLDDEILQIGEMLKVPYLGSRGGSSEPALTPPPNFRLHTIKHGETLSAVSQAYDISIEAIIGANPDLDSIDVVEKGLELLIPPSAGLVVRVDDIEDVVNVVENFNLDSSTVAKANKIESPADIQKHSLLFLPGVKPLRSIVRIELKRMQTTLKRAMKEQAMELEQRYTWPLRNKNNITEFYGRRAGYIRGASMQHRGIDFGAPTGTPIFAARAGTVIVAEHDRVYGNIVKIKHFGGDVTWYAHASKLLVEVGEKVRRGETIALIGSTGLATGPHLHFELRSFGGSVNPLNYLEENTD